MEYSIKSTSDQLIPDPSANFKTFLSAHQDFELNAVGSPAQLRKDSDPGICRKLQVAVKIKSNGVSEAIEHLYLGISNSSD